jgi:hypothetical protein
LVFDKCILISVSGKSGCKDTKSKQKQVDLPIAELEKRIKKNDSLFQKNEIKFHRIVS